MNMYVYFIVGILFLPAIIFAIIAEARVELVYKKYSKIACEKCYTGEQVARAILDSAKLYDYKVNCISGELTDNFNPKTKTVSLSEKVYNGSSVASLGIACHEVGHALQYAENYAPMKTRHTLVKISNIASKILWPIIIVGFIFSFLLLFEPISHIILISGIVFYGGAFLVNVITLPVEYNASNRAKSILIESGICGQAEMEGVNKVLNSAALTYVATMVVSLTYLLRFIFFFLGVTDKD